MFRNNLMDIEIGDVIFFKINSKRKTNTDSDNNNDNCGDGFRDAVADVATESVIHTGFICDNTMEYVLHASRNLGVCEELLKNILENLTIACIEIYRPQLSEKIRRNAYQWAKTKIGAKYNDIFSPEMINSQKHEAYYCCQLIAKSFAAVGVSDFSPKHQLNFTNSNGQFLPYWLNYFQQLHLPIPQGQPGSHPAKLIHSKYLKLHYARFTNTMVKFTLPTTTIDNALHFINGSRMVLKGSKFFDIYQPRNGLY